MTQPEPESVLGLGVALAVLFAAIVGAVVGLAVAQGADWWALGVVPVSFAAWGVWQISRGGQ